MSHPITSRIHADPSIPPCKAHSYTIVEKNGKSYRVELFKNNEDGGIEDLLATDGNWSDTAKAAVDYLAANNGTKDAQGTVFDFNHFQTADLEIEAPANQGSCQIRSFNWTVQQHPPDESSIQAGSLREQQIQTTLTKLGTTLTNPSSDRTTPILRYHSNDHAPYLSDLVFPKPKKLSDLIQQPSDSNQQPAYYPLDRPWMELGGGGDCGVYSLIDAKMQSNASCYPSEEAWKLAYTESQTNVRYETAQTIFNASDQFIHHYFDRFILGDIKEQKVNIQQTLSSVDQKIFNSLLLQDELTLEQKKWLTQTYAIYISQSGRDIDNTFFLTYALQNNKNVAIITEKQDSGVNKNHRFEITQVFPPDAPQHPLTRDNTLFIRTDIRGRHHQSVNCFHPEFQNILKLFNAPPSE